LSKNGASRLWSAVFLLALLFAAASEAAVTLTPRVVEGAIVGSESYVWFGKYKHLLSMEYADGDYVTHYETEATPVLWRVMEVNGTKATLLSHYLADAVTYR